MPIREVRVTDQILGWDSKIFLPPHHPKMPLSLHLQNVLAPHPLKCFSTAPLKKFATPSPRIICNLIQKIIWHPSSKIFAPQNKKKIITHPKFLFASSPPKCFLPPHSQKSFLLSPCYHPITIVCPWFSFNIHVWLFCT